MGNREGLETERLLLCDAGEIRPEVFKFGLKTNGKKRKKHLTPPLFVYLLSVLIHKGSVTMALCLHSNRQCISHKG